MVVRVHPEFIPLGFPAPDRTGVESSASRSRRQLMPFLIICCVGLLICFLCYSSYLSVGGAGGFAWVAPFGFGSSGLGYHWQAQKKEERRACHFPRLDPFDKSIRQFIKDPPPIKCFDGDHELRFKTNFQNQLIHLSSDRFGANESCCFKALTREKESDQNMKYSKKCFPITNTTTNISLEYEFISVRCTKTVASNASSATTLTTVNKLTLTTTHHDMFAFVPIKPKVESRISEILKKNKETMGRAHRMNVLILGLDAQSRMNFIRQMPLTRQFLEQKLGAVSLEGYTKVGDNTFPNVIPILTGIPVDNLKCWPNKSSYFDKCPFIWQLFSAAGYRTLFAEDNIWMSTFTYEKKGFKNPPTDYYLHPQILQMEKRIGHETWGNAKLCYGPRLAFEILLDYIVKTAVTMGTQKNYFQFVWANSLFHDYLNNPKLGDEILALSLQHLFNNGYFNNTLLLLISDHGIRWGSIRSTYQGKIEERMPMAYLAFPPSFKDRYVNEMENLRQNGRSRLTTPFDIHATLLHVLELGKTERVQVNSTEASGGTSLLLPISSTRTCHSAKIAEHWCVCNSMQYLPKNCSLVIDAGKFIVDEINRGLSLELCAKLSLYKINDVVRKIDGELDSGLDLDLEKTENSTQSKIKVQLQISLVTVPGNAVFEATLVGGRGNWNISGEISRLNLYREQSGCIRDYMAQKYCYCLNFEKGLKNSDQDDEEGRKL